MLEFTNSETAAQFEALTDSDRIITKQKQYRGALRNIPPAVAEGMVQRGSNLLQRKTFGTPLEAQNKGEEITIGKPPKIKRIAVS